jgi:hypothetical protein
MADTTAPSNSSPGEITNTNPLAEIGVSGIKQATGYLWEEYLPQLRGRQGIRVYQEMSQNDPTVGAILRAMELIVKALDWNVTPIDDSPAADEGKQFLESVMTDMSHTWQDFLSEALTMLAYGFSYHEIVWKKRNGPDQQDPSQRSNFTDGKIGIRKLAPRSQDSLLRWEMQPDGGIAGFHQLPPMGGGIYYIPIERALLFRTVSRKNSPEGVSMLRNAYRPWYFLKSIEEYEAIGIERELAGVPVISIPATYLSSKDPKDIAVRQAYEKVARDLKFNEQAGIVIPSDTFTDQDGKPTTVKKVEIKLLTSAGKRTIDTSAVALRHQQSITRTVLADFIMMGEQAGNSRGSYSMHQGKVDLFMKAAQAVVDQLADPLNRFLVPRLWAINGLPRETMPQFSPAKVSQIDMLELGTYLTDLATAGVLTPDDDLENFAREAASMPPKVTSDSL